jgi:SDR family mycofactocin-dependent oxidoreductase
MTTAATALPMLGLRVTAGPVELRGITDDLIGPLADLAIRGIHDPGTWQPSPLRAQADCRRTSRIPPLHRPRRLKYRLALTFLTGQIRSLNGKIRGGIGRYEEKLVARVEGKVAFITGAARGQGRSHAVRLAQEGADIIAVDVCHGFDTVPYDGATEADLDETVKLVESLDRRIVAQQADVRDLASLRAAVDAGLAQFGHIDIVIANAGIASFAPALDLTEEMWQDVIDINLTGLWKTVKATAPSMVERGEGGSIILTSSVAGIIAFPALAHYTAAKHGVVGLMRALAVELAPSHIRVNSVHPTTVDTPMIANPAGYSLFMGGAPDVTREQAAVGMKALNALPVPWVEAVDVSNAVLYLASDEARYVTGTTMVIDAGAAQPFKIPHAG